jgi:hypothetical protein
MVQRVTYGVKRVGRLEKLLRGMNAPYVKATLNLY